MCGSCRCGKCPTGGKQFTLKEERELALKGKGLRLKNNKWTAVYPRRKHPAALPNNSSVAAAMLFSTERRLSKCPELATAYQEEIEKMVNNGYARILGQKELQEYKGPIH